MVSGIKMMYFYFLALPSQDASIKTDIEIETEIEEDGKVEIEIKSPAKHIFPDTFVNVTAVFFKGSNAYHTIQKTISINDENDDEEVNVEKEEEDGKVEIEITFPVKNIFPNTSVNVKALFFRRSPGSKDSKYRSIEIFNRALN